MKLTSVFPLVISQFIVYLEGILRSNPNDVFVLSGLKGASDFDGTTDQIGNLLYGTRLKGSSDLYLHAMDGAWDSTDDTEIFAAPIANVIPVAITQVASRWEAVAASLATTNLAENLSGIATRTTLSGVSELTAALLAGQGTGLSDVSGIVLDQPNSRIAIIEKDITLSVSATQFTLKSHISEIVAAGQGFFEAA